MSRYREIIAARIGRPLEPGEEVHHANGNHHDDRPGNLLLLSKEMHQRVHGAMRQRKREWLESAAWRWIYRPGLYTHGETVELTRITNPSFLAEIGEIDRVPVSPFEVEFTKASVDAFLARGGVRGRAAS